ncbi:MAG: pyridoxal-phosphate-dependent aminotransferase family protein [Candidatus Sericytochromatia bacterium]
MSLNALPHLMLPGPTPLPPAVLQAMSTPMLNHRGPDWSALYREVEAGVKWLCQTEHDVVMLAGSGTTGMEAALTNLFSPGDRVLAVSNGSFGERFGQMAEAFGLQTDRLSYEWGSVINWEDLVFRLEQDGPYKGVLLVHNETSSGVLNPLKDLCEVIKESGAGALCIVDAVSSLGTTEIHPDEWGIDVLITASQKGYLAPPGLTMLAISPTAWDHHENARLPRYSLDFKLAREYAESGWTPWTPPIPVFYALQAGFALLRAEGLPNLHARHAQTSRAVRAAIRALGLTLLVDDDHFASRAVTPVFPPANVPAEDLRNLMLINHHIMLAAGQRKLSGQIFRIGHLGHQPPYLVLGVLSALEICLRELGHSVEPGVATAAAQIALRST